MISHEFPMMFHEVPFMFPEVPMMFHEVPMMLYNVSLLLCIGFSRSWPCLCWAGVEFWILPVLVLCLLGCGCAQASLGLGLAFAGLWLCTGFPHLGLGFAGLWFCSGFPQFWSGHCWAEVMHRLPLVFVSPLLAWSWSIARLWLCTGFTRSLSCLRWPVVLLRHPPVCPLLGCGCDRFPLSWSCLCLASSSISSKFGHQGVWWHSSLPREILLKIKCPIPLGL